MGISRSTTVVAAWLLKETISGKDYVPISDKMLPSYLDECILFIKQRRRQIQPNQGFLKQLKEWEAEKRDLKI
jgi:protein-tyrosine phosphatase